MIVKRTSQIFNKKAILPRFITFQNYDAFNRKPLDFLGTRDVVYGLSITAVAGLEAVVMGRAHALPLTFAFGMAATALGSGFAALAQQNVLNGLDHLKSYVIDRHGEAAPGHNNDRVLVAPLRAHRNHCRRMTKFMVTTSIAAVGSVFLARGYIGFPLMAFGVAAATRYADAWSNMEKLLRIDRQYTMWPRKAAANSPQVK